MTTAVGTFGWLLLAVVTAVSSDSSHCGVDRRLTPSDDVLAGMNTPVYFYRTNKSAELGYSLSSQEDAMVNFKKQSRFLKDFKNEGAGIIDKCNNSDVSPQGTPECMVSGTVYPKIVVFVDYSFYSDYKQKYAPNHLTALLEFVLASWNTVDRQFRNLECPKMRLNIAGIIVEENSGGTLYRCSSNSDERKGCDIDKAMDTLGDFMNTKGSSWSQLFGNYDIFTVMTKENLYDSSSFIFSSRIGAQRSRLMCSEREKGPPATIMYSYRSSLGQAAELSSFIQDAIKSNTSDNDDSSCRKSAEVQLYSGEMDITSAVSIGQTCLLKSLEKRFNTQQAKCFFDKPEIGSPLPRILLGQLFSTEPCSSATPGACDEGENICEEVPCNDSFWRNLQASCEGNSRQGVDGTSCGTGKICLETKCVLKADYE